MTISRRELSADFVVVGGGIAGLCAAVAAARNGARTVIIQDRPMFGGNASSEIRMWICGAHEPNRKETGLLEELQLDNYYYNPTMKYTIWDDVMYSFAKREKNLTVLLNTSVEKVETANGRITSVTGWNLVEYRRYKVTGKLFADCSGDSILRLSGAKFRSGREARAEFDEPHAPEKADAKTMGNSILIQLRKTGRDIPFRAPEWAYHYTEETLPKRNFEPQNNNFWWMEFGGLKDTIADADEIRDELYRIAYGCWEYIHNSGLGKGWELDWIGSLPGKRENIRYVGDHMLSQKEVEAEGKFHDTIAYGGWSMDDHHPEAIYYPGAPTIFHPAPSPFGIPYRCLYSANIDNLFFAGRNISCTHMAMSSTRVMGTTALFGQAVGTAAALAIRYDATPREVGQKYLENLQQTLLDQDQFLPGIPRKVSKLSLRGKASHELLVNGRDRDWDDGLQGVEFPVNGESTFRFDAPERVSGVRLVFDSDLSDYKKQLNVEDAAMLRPMPAQLPRKFRIEGDGKVLARVEENRHRLVHLAWTGVKCSEIKLVLEEGWSNRPMRVFSFEVR